RGCARWCSHGRVAAAWRVSHRRRGWRRASQPRPSDRRAVLQRRPLLRSRRAVPSRASRGRRNYCRATRLRRQALRPQRAGEGDRFSFTIVGMSLAEHADVVELPQHRSPLRAALVAMRPRQWTKNLLLFAGIIFAAKLGDGWRWLDAFAAFAAYCAASSAAYLLNDVRDVEHDRGHPVKRARPIARGELSPRAAYVLAAALLA